MGFLPGFQATAGDILPRGETVSLPSHISSSQLLDRDCKSKGAISNIAPGGCQCTIINCSNLYREQWGFCKVFYALMPFEVRTKHLIYIA